MLKQKAALFLASVAAFIVAAVAWPSGRVPVPGAASFVSSSNLLLTASQTVSWPSDTGLQIDLYDSLSLQWKVEEATGTDPGVDVIFEQSNDGTNWGIPYTANTAQAKLNGASPWATETTWRIDKLTTIPGKYIRIRITETAGDADTTFHGVLYAQ